MSDYSSGEISNNITYFDIVEITKKAQAGDELAKSMIISRKRERHLANKKIINDEFPPMTMPF
jgi:hypothetical protein